MPTIQPQFNSCMLRLGGFSSRIPVPAAPCPRDLGVAGVVALLPDVRAAGRPAIPVPVMPGFQDDLLLAIAIPVMP